MKVIHHDGFGAKAVSAVHQIDLAGDVAEIQRFFHGGVAAANHADGFAAIEKAVASGAGAHAAPHVGLFRRQAQVFGRGAGGDDEGVARVNRVVARQGERPGRQIGRVDVVHHQFGAKALGMRLQALHQIRPLHAGHISGPVVHFSGVHELPALGHAGDEHGLKIGAGGIDGGGIAGRAGAKNEKADVSGFHGDGGRWFHAPECKKDVQK